MSTVTKLWLGVGSDGSYVEAELEGNTLRGFHEYYIAVTVDETEVLDCHSWSHEVKIGDRVLRRGQKLGKNYLTNFTKKQWTELKALYKADLYHCDSCGAAHESEQYRDCTYTLIDCQVYCKGCLSPEDVLVEVTEPKDIYKSHDVSGVLIPDDEWEEVAELFCDSSGMGRSSEPALTKTGTLGTVERLMKEHGTLYAGLTGIGQFQVYVTLYKKQRKLKVAK